MRSLYNIGWGQCIKLMKNKLKSSSKFEDSDINRDVTLILKEIRSISHQLEANVLLYDLVDKEKRAYYLYKQEPEDLNSTHLKKLQNKYRRSEAFG